MEKKKNLIEKKEESHFEKNITFLASKNESPYHVGCECLNFDLKCRLNLQSSGEVALDIDFLVSSCEYPYASVNRLNYNGTYEFLPSSSNDSNERKITLNLTKKKSHESEIKYVGVTCEKNVTSEKNSESDVEIKTQIDINNGNGQVLFEDPKQIFVGSLAEQWMDLLDKYAWKFEHPVIN